MSTGGGKRHPKHVTPNKQHLAQDEPFGLHRQRFSGERCRGDRYNGKYRGYNDRDRNLRSSWAATAEVRKENYSFTRTKVGLRVRLNNSTKTFSIEVCQQLCP